MITTEPLLLIMAFEQLFGNFVLAIQAMGSPVPIEAVNLKACFEYFIAQLESKDRKKNFTDGNGELKVLTLAKKELEWLRTVHAPTIAENANEIVAACYHLKEFGARLDPFCRPLQPV